jgi:hypothetical protein
MGTSGEIQHRAEELDCACAIPDLITPEEKAKFFEIYQWLRENYVMQKQYKSHGEFGTEGSYIKYGIELSGCWSGWRSEDRAFALNVANRYNFNRPNPSTVQILYLPAGYEGTRHIDTYPARRCVISVPLSVTDNQPLNFYESCTSEEPLVSLCYDGPTLLNIEQKWHQIPASSKDRVLLQIPFGEIYQDAKKQLLAMLG